MGEWAGGRYGVDPVFYEHTSLFKAELAKNVHRFYDTTSGYHCNDVTSGDELCKPRPFYKPDKPFAGMDGCAPLARGVEEGGARWCHCDCVGWLGW